LAIAEIGGSGGGGGQPTYISSADSRTTVTQNGYNVTIDTRGISGGSGGGDTVSSLVYDSSTSLLTLTTDESSFSAMIEAGNPDIVYFEHSSSAT